jgi:hypothetical protein
VFTVVNTRTANTGCSFVPVAVVAVSTAWKVFIRTNVLSEHFRKRSNFDSVKAKQVALAVAKGWHELSGQPKVSVSVWQGVNLLAKESVP